MKKTKLFALLLILAVCVPIYGSAAPFGVAFAAGNPTPPPTPAPDLQEIYDKINDLSNQINDLQQIISGGGNPAPTKSPDVFAPKIKLLSPFSVAATGGRSQDVEVTVKNLGTSYAASVLVQAAASGDAPFALSFPDGSNSFQSLTEGASKKLTMRITVDATAKSGSYPVTLTYSYKNAANVNMTDTDTLQVRIDGAQLSTNVILYDFKNDKDAIAPGDVVTVSAVLENTGSAAASDVQITIEGFDAGVYMQGDTTMYYKTLAANNQALLKIPVAIAAAAKPGTYPLMFKVGYKDAAGAAASNSFVYYLNVNSAQTGGGRGRVEIVRIAAPAGNYAVGQDFTFIVELKNNGDADASNLRIIATPEDSGIVPTSVNTQIVSSLPKGEMCGVSFTFAATASAKTRNYVVNFKLSYEGGGLDATGSAAVTSLEQYAGVNVSVPEDSPAPSPTAGAGVSKPKIIVDSYGTDPQIVKAGQDFTLELVFKNTHRIKTIANIKIVLAALETTSQTGSVFTPVNCSNTIFIDEIAPGGTHTQNLHMYTVPDAAPRTYTIAVNYEYQDAEFNNYSESEQIGISVKQATKLETSEISITTSGMPGAPIPLSFSIINSGKVDLANLRVWVEADMDTSNANVFLGQLKQGSSTYFDGYITPTAPGIQEGRLIISCEDSSGEIVSIEKDFTVDVMDFGGGMDGGFWDDGGGRPIYPGDMGMGEVAGGGFLGMFKSLSRTLAIVIEAAILAAAVVLAVVITMAVRRRRRRRRQEEDDD